jgi:hypothetical protein
MSDDHGITGRDNFILVQALALAIAVIPRLPTYLQPKSDRDDMRKLLVALAGGDDQRALDMAAEIVSHLPEAPGPPFA